MGGSGTAAPSPPPPSFVHRPELPSGVQNAILGQGADPRGSPAKLGQEGPQNLGSYPGCPHLLHLERGERTEEMQRERRDYRVGGEPREWVPPGREGSRKAKWSLAARGPAGPQRWGAGGEAGPGGGGAGPGAVPAS